MDHINVLNTRNRAGLFERLAMDATAAGRGHKGQVLCLLNSSVAALLANVHYLKP